MRIGAKPFCQVLASSRARMAPEPYSATIIIGPGGSRNAANVVLPDRNSTMIEGIMKRVVTAAYLLSDTCGLSRIHSAFRSQARIEQARDDKLPRCPGESSISRSPFSAGNETMRWD